MDHHQVSELERGAEFFVGLEVPVERPKELSSSEELSVFCELLLILGNLELNTRGSLNSSRHCCRQVYVQGSEVLAVL